MSISPGFMEATCPQMRLGQKARVAVALEIAKDLRAGVDHPVKTVKPYLGGIGKVIVVQSPEKVGKRP